MINDKITIVTSPDYDHNSDYKICLVGDTPLIENILTVLDKDERRISVHCVTKKIQILLGLQIQLIQVILFS